MHTKTEEAMVQDHPRKESSMCLHIIKLSTNLGNTRDDIKELNCGHFLHKKCFEVFVEDDPDSFKCPACSPECSICLENLLDSNRKVLACKHEFHQDCIDGWLKLSATCPECRITVCSSML